MPNRIPYETNHAHLFDEKHDKYSREVKCKVILSSDLIKCATEKSPVDLFYLLRRGEFFATSPMQTTIPLTTYS